MREARNAYIILVDNHSEKWPLKIMRNWNNNIKMGTWKIGCQDASEFNCLGTVSNGKFWNK
jgi:hypothetical protein